MIYHYKFDPLAKQFRSPEDKRLHEEQLRNIQRLVDHNNRRIRIGLRPYAFPDALIDFLYPVHRDNITLIKR